MKSYLQILNKQAKDANVSLLRAFSRAMIPTSTYYRTIKGTTEIRYDTALKVHHAIEQVRQIQQAVEDTKGLRSNGKPVNRRSIKARVKSRRASA